MERDDRGAPPYGAGRATLYKYFPDVRAILLAWHEREVAAHLDHLFHARDESGTAGERPAAVLDAYARIQHERARRHRQAGAELGALLHHVDRTTGAQRQVHDLLRDLLAAAAQDVRSGMTYRRTNSPGTAEAAVRRLVTVVMSGLGP